MTTPDVPTIIAVTPANTSASYLGEVVGSFNQSTANDLGAPEGPFTIRVYQSFGADNTRIGDVFIFAFNGLPEIKIFASDQDASAIITFNYTSSQDAQAGGGRRLMVSFHEHDHCMHANAGAA